MGVHSPEGQGRLGICLPEATQFFFLLVCMDLRHVWVCGQGLPIPLRTPLHLVLVTERTQTAAYLPKPVPQNLSSLSGLLGLLESTPLGTSGDGMVPALSTVVSFGCAQQGCGAGKRPTGTPCGLWGASLPSPKAELVFPPPSPGQAAFLPFFFFLLFPSCQRGQAKRGADQK